MGMNELVAVVCTVLARSARAIRVSAMGTGGLEGVRIEAWVPISQLDWAHSKLLGLDVPGTVLVMKRWLALHRGFAYTELERAKSCQVGCDSSFEEIDAALRAGAGRVTTLVPAAPPFNPWTGASDLEAAWEMNVDFDWAEALKLDFVFERRKKMLELEGGGMLGIIKLDLLRPYSPRKALLDDTSTIGEDI